MRQRTDHCTAATGDPRPIVMILGGGDTTCEEMYDFGGGAAAVRRGYSAFLWEGPGQVGAYALDRELTYRPDWQVPTRYAVDYVPSREDVDAKKLALSGHSMGGYFAPRAVAFEKRIAAVIANSLAPDLKPVLLTMMGLDSIVQWPRCQVTDCTARRKSSGPWIRENDSLVPPLPVTAISP